MRTTKTIFYIYGLVEGWGRGMKARLYKQIQDKSLMFPGLLSKNLNNLTGPYYKTYE